MNKPASTSIHILTKHDKSPARLTCLKFGLIYNPRP